MPGSTYIEYFYFNNDTGLPNEQHNKFMLDQEQDYYITSLQNFMDETLTSLPKLFVNQTGKKDGKHIKVLAQ